MGICAAQHRWEFDISNGVLKWKCIFLSKKHLNISVSSSRPATRHKNGFRSLLQKMLYSVHLGRGIIIATIDHAGECAADTEHSGDTPHAHCHNHNIIYHIKSVYIYKSRTWHFIIIIACPFTSSLLDTHQKDSINNNRVFLDTHTQNIGTLCMCCSQHFYLHCYTAP